MNKTLLALASMAAIVSIPSLALAQSTVTLYGVADLAVGKVKNGSAGSQTRMASGSSSTSRWGVRGVEDLGGGLKAGFNFEQGINVATGAIDTTRAFGRRATVSLMGGFGEIRLGRQYTPTALNTFADEFGVVGVGSRGIFSYGAGSNLGSTATTVLRADNAVSYFLPSMGGIYGQFQASTEGSAVGNKYVGGRVGYKNGPIDLGVAFGKTETGTTPDFKNYNIQFNYDFGFALLQTLLDVKQWSPRESKDLSIAASIPVGGQGSVKVGYTLANRSGGAIGSGFGDADDSTRFGLGYVHNLSKRTALYTTYGLVTNKGAARSSVNYTAPAEMLGGEKSSGIEFGVRHTF